MDSKLHPYVEVRVKGSEQDFEVDCLVDTGFAGGVVLPQELRDKVDFTPMARRVWRLADGSEIELVVFAGQIGFKGEEKKMAILFIDRGEGLVGIEFLKGMRFVLDLKEREVELS